MSCFRYNVYVGDSTVYYCRLKLTHWELDIEIQQATTLKQDYEGILDYNDLLWQFDGSNKR